MYYEEQLIDGVLHYRTSPAQDYRPMSLQQVTELLLKERKASMAIQKTLRSTLDECTRMLRIEGIDSLCIEL